MKQLIISSIFFVISFVLFSTCSKESNPVVTPTEKNENASLEKKKKKWPAVIYDSTYGEIVMDYNVITPMAAPCGEKQTYGWGFDHFQSKVGKYLGVCLTNQIPYIDLYRKYGFNQLFVSSYSNKLNALAAGFKQDSLMGGINHNTNSIDQFGTIGYYHWDEAVEHGFSSEEIRWIANYIHDYYPNSKLMLSSYKPVSNPYYSQSYLNVLVNASNSYMMCDQYYDGTIWYGNDQRPFWTDYKNFYTPQRVPAHWIAEHIDGPQGDFNMLFGHANNLGVNSLWYYMLESNGGYFFDFCSSAWYNGWLRKFEQYFKIVWRCTLQDPCDCDPSDPDAGWYIYQVLPLGSYREVFP